MGIVKIVSRLIIIRNLICWLGSLYIRFVFVTGIWKSIGEEIPADFWNKDKPFILCFWHGRLLMMPYCWNFSKPINLLTSQHRDGQLISKTVSHFGFSNVTGSSSKGGAKALRNIVKKLSFGESVGLTPDGPRGPCMRVGEGIIAIARLSGAPIIPIAFSINKGKILNTWDRFLLALPFSRGIYIWGEPIFISRESSAASQEEARLEVEKELMKITNNADKLCGRAIIDLSKEPTRSENTSK